ncbi:ABC transporter ATP-binding protein [Paraburkholderia fungorum]
MSDMEAIEPRMPTDPVEPMIELRGVSKRFGARDDLLVRSLARIGAAKLSPQVYAVNDVSLTVRRGEVVGLVGESGCGKSTLGRMVAGIMRPSEGSIFWRGSDVDSLSALEDRQRKLRVQMVFQNPFASLNPRMSVGDIVGEAPRIHGLVDSDHSAYVDDQMRRAGIDPAVKSRYPHQFSGGQRQRIGIARALAVNPEFLVCDEAVAALDVSIQAQILNLFMDLRESLGLTYLFISHDLGVVEHISDRVAIMYLGRIVEEAPTEEVFGKPNHPYTQALLEEVPRIDTTRKPFSFLKGELPSPLSPPGGCHFHPRCPHAMARCKEDAPLLKTIAPGHRSACHLNDIAL